MVSLKTLKIFRNAGIIAGIAAVSSLAADPHIDINKFYVALLAGALTFLIECKNSFMPQSKKAATSKTINGTFFF